MLSFLEINKNILIYRIFNTITSLRSISVDPYSLTCTIFLMLVPSMPPQSVTAHNLTSAVAINVTWTPVPVGHVNGLLMGYSIKYQRIRTAELGVVDADEHTLTVKSTDLLVELQVQTYSIYKIQVAAFTQKGMGPYSEFVYGGKKQFGVETWLHREINIPNTREIN